MKSLRARIAFVLVVSIVAVVALATSATVFIVSPPGPETFVEPVVLQVQALIPFYKDQGTSAFGLTERPVAGAEREMFSLDMQSAFRRAGLDYRVIVTKPPDRNMAVASVELPGRGWFAVPMPDHPSPKGVWLALASWMCLIIVGAIAIALGVTHRIARPLALLESVASNISRSGQMTVLPEIGPAEVKATARALNGLTANLKAAMESRMRLVAAAGHDLRTPITRMRLRAEFLPENEQGAWFRDLDELRRIADSSIQLVHEEIEKTSDEMLRLDTLTQSVVEDLAATGHAAVFAESSRATIRAAPLAITRLLRNLVINAATHGEGCVVKVESRSGWVVVIIDDRGPGIPENVIDRVFEPFFRADPARTQHVAGAGLGLAIAREIIARHQGEIILTNRVTGGLRQQIRFPACHFPQRNDRQNVTSAA